MAFLQKYLAQFDIETLLMTILNKGLSLILLYLVFYIAKKIAHASVQRIVAPSLRLSSHSISRQKTLTRLVDNILDYSLYFVLLFSMLSILGLPVASLLAGAGIAGVAIGMGAQGFLSDLVNGFFILVEHQFDVGDCVRLTNGPIVVEGIIINVGIRTSQVRDADGTLHFIPNRNILVVSNKSRGDMRVQIDLPLAPNVDLETVSQLVEAVNQEHVPAYSGIKACTVLGAQTSAKGQFSYRIHLIVENGEQSVIYHTFYSLYQRALLEAGILLAPSPVWTGK